MNFLLIIPIKFKVISSIALFALLNHFINAPAKITYNVDEFSTRGESQLIIFTNYYKLDKFHNIIYIDEKGNVVTALNGCADLEEL